ncbi:hypothetical protein EMIHUDRAFT_99833 [Emiliania huxleyi CCMP1516]|uniref:Uncharacterized protein n=2 Tax=Emiliania huxleyi TaxID=2903 RepID=A0A0D3JXT4_EMIH1|nr:hypothetical protein EMIHUDRAFT_99833 [Emiliania huxleyi CCMP1516]EOD28319.1 hypothetical protein EMIHUDRAFT_99833 [Emiliania huxleyi CCMP1516]|eukprot:XP_005780748.1 hypothetical protein EMIHUDRAFT_99833 [Emiliania huxleyi CCMP1516]
MLLSAASLQVWALTGVVISCIFARHGVAAAAIYWALTSVALTADTSLQSLQLLNLAVVALGAEWLLELLESEVDESGSAKPHRFCRAACSLLVPTLTCVLLATGCRLLVASSPLLLQPRELVGSLLDPWRSATSLPSGFFSQAIGSRCVGLADCIYPRIHGVYERTGRSCQDKPVYRQRSTIDSLFLHSPGFEHQWNIGPVACDNSPRLKWMERYSVAETAEELDNSTWFETSPTSSWDGIFLEDGSCNGKPAYTRAVRYGRAEGGNPPASLYSPARRNSWLIGTEPCRSNGWVEVRSMAERAELLQAGSSGPWQEFNGARRGRRAAASRSTRATEDAPRSALGSAWSRSDAIRALTHCGASTGCVYIFGSRYQPHTHGLYMPTDLECSGVPVYEHMQDKHMQQADGGRPASEASDEGGLYLYSPTGRESRMTHLLTSPPALLMSPPLFSRRESWMVGREVCKPSGWLELHSGASLLEGIGGVWREHVPGGSWRVNAEIKLQLHPLQDVFSGFAYADGRASLRDPHRVLWRVTSLLSDEVAPPTDDEKALVEGLRSVSPPSSHPSAAQRLRRMRFGGAPDAAQVDGEAARGSARRAPRGAASRSIRELGRRLRQAAADAAGRTLSEEDHEDGRVCGDLAAEPSLEGGRLLFVEVAASRGLAERLSSLGWHFAWTRAAHYNAAGVRRWLSTLESVSSRLHPVRRRAEGRATEGNRTSEPLGLRAWRKVAFTAADIVDLREACAAHSLELDALTLLTADRVQALPMASLSLTPSLLSVVATCVLSRQLGQLLVGAALLAPALLLAWVCRLFFAGEPVAARLKSLLESGCLEAAAHLIAWSPSPLRAVLLLSLARPPTESLVDPPARPAESSAPAPANDDELGRKERRPKPAKEPSGRSRGGDAAARAVPRRGSESAALPRPSRAEPVKARQGGDSSSGRRSGPEANRGASDVADSLSARPPVALATASGESSSRDAGAVAAAALRRPPTSSASDGARAEGRQALAPRPSPDAAAKASGVSDVAADGEDAVVVGRRTASDATTPASPAAAPERGGSPDRFCFSDASLAEQAALSVLEDFPFDLPDGPGAGHEARSTNPHQPNPHHSPLAGGSFGGSFAAAFGPRLGTTAGAGSPTFGGAGGGGGGSVVIPALPPLFDLPAAASSSSRDGLNPFGLPARGDDVEKVVAGLSKAELLEALRKLEEAEMRHYTE